MSKNNSDVTSDGNNKRVIRNWNRSNFYGKGEKNLFEQCFNVL
jgi:hypothetical protein